MDGGPRRIFDVGSACRVQESSLDEVVERGLELLQWLSLIACVRERVVGCRECGVEKPWLCAGELEVCPANGLEPESRPRRCVRSRADPAHPFCHALRQPSHRLVADRREQRVAIGEMPVGGIGNDPDHARHLAQHDRVRPARSGELDASLDERGAHGAAGPGSPASGPIARLRVTHLTKL